MKLSEEIFIRVLHLNPEDHLMAYVILILVSQLIAPRLFLEHIGFGKLRKAIVIIES